MKKIIKAALGFLALLTAGCDNGKHCCDSCCHHDHPLIQFKNDAIYKITPAANFDKSNADDCVILMPIDQQSGFIHTAYGSQVIKTLNKFFADAKDILVLELDSSILKQRGTDIRPEANKPGGDIFPHLYGTQKIPVAAIKEIKTLKKNKHGEWKDAHSL